MTVHKFGRITPLQGDMLAFAGHVLSRGRVDSPTDKQRIEAIAEGHACLVKRVGEDLGYGLRPWHERLLSDGTLGREYRHPYAWRVVRQTIELAFDDPERERLVTALLRALN